MPDIRSKALGYLRDERVRVLYAETVKPSLRPHAVGALVQGFQGRYWVEFNRNRWLCSCGFADCAHLAAVQLITGYPSAAAKADKGAEAKV